MSQSGVITDGPVSIATEVNLDEQAEDDGRQGIIAEGFRAPGSDP